MKTENAQRTPKESAHAVRIAIEAINPVLKDYRERAAPVIRELAQLKSSASSLKKEIIKIEAEIGSMIKYMEAEMIRCKKGVISRVSSELKTNEKHINTVGGYEKHLDNSFVSLQL